MVEAGDRYRRESAANSIVSLKSRSDKKEILDDPNTEPKQIRFSLDFMRIINRFFGGAEAVRQFFDHASVPQSFTVLDVACGGGDIPYALLRWAQSCGKKISITAIDLNPHCLEYARQHHSHPQISFVHHSAFEIQSLGSFDYMISSMFFHHLSDDEIIAMLSLMNRFSKKGFLVNDLYRSLPNYAAAALAGAFSAQPIVYHDAKLSVARAFRKEDFQRYAAASELPLFIDRKPLFRIIAGMRK
jgi:ubiquinone/menaquinone biosynthesis C-methylase UbiE